MLDGPTAAQQPRAQVDFEDVSASGPAVEETVILRDLKGKNHYTVFMHSRLLHNEKLIAKTINVIENVHLSRMKAC